MMIRRRIFGMFVVRVAWLLTGVSFAAPAPVMPPSLSDFANRAKVSKAELPLIIKAAEAAAARKVEHPDSLLDITYALQSSFAEELLNRSGGLATALPTEERSGQVTPNDVVIFSIRSWATDGGKGLDYLQNCRNQGWMIILFASSAGRPADLDVDGFIDNGAETGGDDDAAVNSAANALNGWLWVCEYTSALTGSESIRASCRASPRPGRSPLIARFRSRKHAEPISSHARRRYRRVTWRTSTCRAWIG